MAGWVAAAASAVFSAHNNQIGSAKGERRQTDLTARFWKSLRRLLGRLVVLLGGRKEMMGQREDKAQQAKRPESDNRCNHFHAE
jgi:hypothetical protein